MKKYGILLGLIATGMAISSCSYFYPYHHQAAARLPSRQQLCTHLRQQMIFKGNPNNMNLNGPNMITSTPINRARVSNDYQRFNCNQFEPTTED